MVLLKYFDKLNLFNIWEPEPTNWLFESCFPNTVE